MRALPFAFSGILFAVPLVKAQPSCPFDASQAGGNQVYYFDGRNAVSLSAAPLQGRPNQRLKLYYVVRASENRSGALVIKTAQLNRPADVARPVKIARKEVSECDPRKRENFREKVTTQAYSDFHDRGQKYPGHGEDDDWAKLKDFHTLYAINGGCRDSSSRTDPNGVPRVRSNRSQFSFDTGVVDAGLKNGPITILSKQYGVNEAYAGTLKLQDRHAEIKFYRTMGGYACVPFDITVREPMQVVRVNDLEARDANYEPGPEFRFGPTIDGGP